jgi:hypothetical protein
VAHLVARTVHIRACEDLATVGDNLLGDREALDVADVVVGVAADGGRVEDPL